MLKQIMYLPTASILQFPGMEAACLWCLSCDLITHCHCTEIQGTLERCTPTTEKQAGAG